MFWENPAYESRKSLTIGTMKIESKELEEYVCASITAIKRGVDSSGFRIANTIEFSLAIINSHEGSGGLKIYVAKAEGKLKSEEISHLKFEVRANATGSVYSPSHARLKPNPAR